LSISYPSREIIDYGAKSVLFLVGPRLVRGGDIFPDSSGVNGARCKMRTDFTEIDAETGIDSIGD
jgi:hypothetical protein